MSVFSRNVRRTANGEETDCWYHLKQGGKALALPIYHLAYLKFDRADWALTIQGLLLVLFDIVFTYHAFLEGRDSPLLVNEVRCWV